MKIFVSYSRKDAVDFAERISKDLGEDEHDVFTDVVNIPPGSDWSNVIEKNISKCELFLVIITYWALKSSNVEREVLQAQRENKIVIPCVHRYVNTNQLKWNLSSFQGIEFRDQYDLAREMPRILSLLNRKIAEVDTGPASPSHKMYEPERLPVQMNVPHPNSVAERSHQKNDLERVQTSPSTKIDAEVYQRLRKGDRYYKDRDYANALRCYDEALKIDPKNQSPYIKKGDVFYSMGKDQEAIGAYEEAIRAKPDDPEAYDLRGDVYLRIRNYEKALISYDEALKIDPESSEYLKDRGLALYGLQKYKDANSSLDKAITANPNNAEAKKYKGSILCQFQKYEEAIKYFDEAIGLDPTYSEAAKERELAAKKKEQEEAKERELAAKKKEQEEAKERELAAKKKEQEEAKERELAAKKKEQEEAKERELAAKKDLHDAAISMTEGIKYLKNRDYSSALSSFDNSISKDPKNTITITHKAEALYGLRRYDDAIKIYDNVLAIKPNDVVALMGKGTVLDSLGKHNQAIECFEMILNTDPKDVNAWNRKGLSLLSMTRSDLAMKSFQKALEIDPTFIPAKENLESANSLSRQSYQELEPLEKEREKYGKRRAIVVGINRYESDSDIQTLGGAENDAKEIYERLRNNGNFEISDKHFMLGPNATKRNILRAFSDIFRKEVNYDVVAIYFSGHAVVDSNHVGYLAPYDMDPEDPLVSGICLGQLMNIINESKNLASVMMFLDCCHAGIGGRNKIKSGPGYTGIDYGKDLISTAFQKMVESPGKPGTPATRGAVILASSEANAVSRERNYAHSDDDKPHSHGAFTFHLIEGIDGKAADSSGVITIGSLKKYVEDEMHKEDRQIPVYNVAGASRIDSIHVAISQNRFRTTVDKLISTAQGLLVVKYTNSDLIDFQYLMLAAKKVSEAAGLEPDNEELPRLYKIINDGAASFSQPTIEWLVKNSDYARRKLNEIEPSLYDLKLPEMVQNLSYDEILKMNQATLKTLNVILAEVVRNTEFKGEDDKNLNRFYQQLRASIHSNKIISEKTNVRHSSIETEVYDTSQIINDGIHYAEHGHYENAIELFDKVIVTSPNNPIPYNQKGDVLSRLERYEEAIQYYDKAMAVEPDNSTTYNHKGNVLFKIKRYNEAIKCFDRALEINPSYAEAWYNKGNVLLESGEINEAMECYDKALEIDPNDKRFSIKRNSAMEKVQMMNKPTRSNTSSVALSKSSEVKFITTWGYQGAGYGQFDAPTGIAVDSGGCVYVVDSKNHRIQKFDRNGNFIRSWGIKGKGNGQFKNILSVAADNRDQIYTLEGFAWHSGTRVQKFNKDGDFVMKWGSYDPFNNPMGIALDTASHVYVTDPGNHSILKFDSNGNFIRKWGTKGKDYGQFDYPCGIAADLSGQIYVVDRKSGPIQKFDSDGNFIERWGTYGSENGQFNLPRFIATDSHNNVYVTDTGNKRIQEFDSNGKFIRSWGTFGSAGGQFGTLYGIAIDLSRSYLYISDHLKHCIAKYMI